MNHRMESLWIENYGMPHVKFWLLNSLKIIRTSFLQNHSWRSKARQHYDLGNQIKRIKGKNCWLRLQFCVQISLKITNFALCRLRIFHIEFDRLKSWYLEFWNFYKLICGPNWSYCCFFSFSTQQSGWISNFRKLTLLL